MRTVYRALYRLRLTPWEAGAVPAPVVDAATGPEALPAGIAVDLGCGTGLQACYLAAHGWAVTAIDSTPKALAAARGRDDAGRQGVGRVEWRLADVAECHHVDPCGHLAGTVTLLLDNGCLHGIPNARRRGWARTVRSLAAPGCVVLVRAIPRARCHLGPAGLAPEELPALLGEGWVCTATAEPHWYRCVRLD